MHSTVAGVDEAGRGSAVGPMVIAGVLLEEEFLEAVKSQGVKDSKRLPPERRERLYEFIVNGAVKVAFTVLNPTIIDRYVKFKKTLGGLNALELKEIVCIVREIRATKVYVDCPDVNSMRFCRILKSEIPWNVEVVALHGKYDDHPAIASASIVAKVLRDRIIRSLRDLYGDFGSGYPSDLKTVSFLKENRGNKHSEWLIRKSWKISKLGCRLNDYAD